MYINVCGYLLCKGLYMKHYCKHEVARIYPSDNLLMSHYIRNVI